MKNYQPTLGIRDTAQNVRFFVDANMGAFWDIYKPLIPYILGLNFLDAVITDLYMPESENGFALGNLISSYFITALVISWHRVVIRGPDHYVPMNPFRPQQSEWAFIGMGILIVMVLFLISFGVLYAATMTKVEILAFIAVIVVVAAIYCGYRLSFYFPAKAVNVDMTLGQAFKLTKGYLWKLIAASFVASIKPMLLMFVWVFLTSFLIGLLVMSVEIGLTQTLGLILMAPVFIYFQPLLTVIGVTVLSNYYLYAMQNENGAREIQV